MVLRMVLIGEVSKPETLYLMFNERYPDIESFLETISNGGTHKIG